MKILTKNRKSKRMKKTYTACCSQFEVPPRIDPETFSSYIMINS